MKHTKRKGNSHGDPSDVVFWCIIHGFCGPDGERIVPTYRTRKKFGLTMSAAQAREWATPGSEWKPKFKTAKAVPA